MCDKSTSVVDYLHHPFRNVSDLLFAKKSIFLTKLNTCDTFLEKTALLYFVKYFIWMTIEVVRKLDLFFDLIFGPLQSNY